MGHIGQKFTFGLGGGFRLLAKNINVVIKLGIVYRCSNMGDIALDFCQVILCQSKWLIIVSENNNPDHFLLNFQRKKSIGF